MKTLINKKLLIEASLLLVALSLNSCSFSSNRCKRLLKESMQEKYDIIIVPGVPFENGHWSNIMKARVCWSIFLYKKGITRNIIYSGSAVYSPYYEAEIMALYAEKLGIPKENIYTETHAEHSTENVFYSYKKARKLGFTRIAIASDPFQTKMLKRFTRKIVSEKIGLIPIVSDTLKNLISGMKDPEIEYRQAFVRNFTSLPERESFMKRLEGTWGLNIDTSAYN
jgi:uncharacterized SAM-binding protein YcdF (DUF218 family)